MRAVLFHHAESATRRVWLLTYLGVCTICITLATVWVLHARSRSARMQAAEMDSTTTEVLSTLGRELTVGRSALDKALELRAKDVGDGRWISKIADEFGDHSGKFGSTRVGIEMKQAAAGLSEMRKAWEDSVDWYARWSRAVTEHGRGNRSLRTALDNLRDCIMTMEGQRRLRSISLLTALRNSDTVDPAATAKQVLREMRSSSDQSQTRIEVADLSLLCEQLSNNKQLDALADLKDNQIKPALQRLESGLRRGASKDDPLCEKSLALFQTFESELLGDGFVIDGSHQTILPGRGGFYLLAEGTLRLAEERDQLRARVDEVFANMQAHVRSVRAATNDLTQQLAIGTDADLSRARSITLLVGLLSGVLLVFLGRRIATSIRRQVSDLRQSREQYRSLVESTGSVPWQWDQDERLFVYVGPQAGPLLGCSAEDWMQPGFFDARLHPDDRESVKTRWASLRDQGKDVELEFRLKRNGGAWVWVRSIVSGAATADAIHLQGFMLDVTERHKMELELQQAQKLESVGRLASGVAHEINTPIQFVSDSIHFVRDAMKDLFAVVESLKDIQRSVQAGEPTDEAVAAAVIAEEEADLAYLEDNVPKALDRSLDGLDRVATIVRSMKEFAHPDQREMAPTDLNRAIASTLTIARNEYKYVAEVVTEFEALPPVTCHAGDVNQAILNIIVNAAHAIGDAVKGTENKGLITIRTHRDGDTAVVQITDTGGGIPESVRAHIFDPFFTTKGVGKGTGQGLAIARSVIVEKHAGELTFESEVGKGTTFTIKLPIQGKANMLVGAAA